MKTKVFFTAFLMLVAGVFVQAQELKSFYFNGKWGFKDASGNEVIAPIYDQVWLPKDGFFIVERNKKQGAYSLDGKQVIPVSYDRVYTHSGYIIVQLDSKKGAYDFNGKQVFPIEYEVLMPTVDSNVFFGKKNGKSSYFTLSGEEKDYSGSNTQVTANTANTEAVSRVKLTNDEWQLYNLIMEYRKQKGLPSIPVSKSLTYVAQAHVKDLQQNFRQGSSMHSWSNKGEWKGCSYTSAQAECMWNKPRELTPYKGHGFENSHWKSSGATPLSAFEGWKGSSGHNAVMINLGVWKNQNWNAIGIGIYGEYAVIWFGTEKDPVQ